MTIFGVDPGSQVTGFAVIQRLPDSTIHHVTHGVIVMKERASLALRLAELSQSFRSLLQKYQPDHVVLENIFLGKNADSAFKLGHARGVLMASAAEASLPIYEYATRQVKKGVAGSGAASKEEVSLSLQRLLKIKTLSQLDATDALALAVYHAGQVTLQIKLKECQI